uniref:8.9 kDa family member n=1 Tax=Rhipicephalus appendiculatus TaxID=34631 RepID=A0A131YR85_RHIAP
MTKLRTYLVIFITLFAARMSRQATLHEPVTYKNGKCHHGGKSYKHGENIYLEPCTILTCTMKNSSFGYVHGTTCGTVSAKPPCKVIPMTVGIYPACCPRAVCP